MNNRQSRLRLISDILKNIIVSSQDELLNLLKKRGCIVTQATLSRDLKSLNTSKIAIRGGGYRYVAGNDAQQFGITDSESPDTEDNLPESMAEQPEQMVEPAMNQEDASARESVAKAGDHTLDPDDMLSVARSGTVIVIRTRPGKAAEVARRLDEVDTPHLIGTVAGYDTLLVIANQRSSSRDLYLAIINVVPVEEIGRAHV